jgi:hypothetical protein
MQRIVSAPRTRMIENWSVRPLRVTSTSSTKVRASLLPLVATGLSELS